jgi:hypothetical protein
MNIREYQSRTHATAIYPEALAIPYTALGLCEEIGELHNAMEDDSGPDAIAGECGDVMWYASECALAWGIDLADVTQLQKVPVPDWVSRCMASMTRQALVIAGLTKKLIRDREMVIDDDRRYKVAVGLAIIVRLVGVVAWRVTGNTLEQVMEANIAKLERRACKGMLKGEGSTR